MKILAALRWLILLALTAYGAFTVVFCAPLSELVRYAIALLIAVGTLAPLIFAKAKSIRTLVPFIVLVSTYGWYFTIRPQTEANWQKDVAVMPHAEITENLLTVHHIRNFHYRSDTDFDVDYYDKTFDLNQLQSVDLFLSYWGTTAIAHTIMSFGFSNGDQLPISIETRKEVGEEYSAVQGFFKKYELIYVVADERDLIGVRVLHRNEDVYLYRLKIAPEEARKMLLDYIATIQNLSRTPVFYNALTTNCTTSILPHIRKFRPTKFSWALLANGYLDRWRYEEGVWGFAIPFEEFRARSKVNDKVIEAKDAADFSLRLRKNLPSIPAQ